MISEYSKMAPVLSAEIICTVVFLILLLILYIISAVQAIRDRRKIKARIKARKAGLEVKGTFSSKATERRKSSRPNVIIIHDGVREERIMVGQTRARAKSMHFTRERVRSMLLVETTSTVDPRLSRDVEQRLSTDMDPRRSTCFTSVHPLTTVPENSVVPGLTMPTALNPPPHLPGSNEAVSPQRYHSPDAASVSASGALTELILSNDNSNN